jgi:cyclophilin family peptidyl-prolyl cis-trans isomerase
VRCFHQRSAKIPGDAQIFFNLVDNFRLDRDYTVFAATRDGLNVMDRVQEGDVIDRIDIIRLH